MANDFIPDSFANRLQWLKDLKQEVADNATTLSLNAAAVTAFNALIDPLIAAYQAVIDAQTVLDTASGDAHQLFHDSNTPLRDFIHQIKANPAFTTGLGNAMRIFTSAYTPPPNTIKPVIKVEPMRGHVRITGTKNYAERVNIYLRRNNAAWLLVAPARKTFPYDDQTPLLVPGAPEDREYMARGIIGDTEVGQDSDIVTCPFAG